MTLVDRQSAASDAPPSPPSPCDTASPPLSGATATAGDAVLSLLSLGGSSSPPPGGAAVAGAGLSGCSPHSVAQLSESVGVDAPSPRTGKLPRALVTEAMPEESRSSPPPPSEASLEPHSAALELVLQRARERSVNSPLPPRPPPVSHAEAAMARVMPDCAEPPALGSKSPPRRRITPQHGEQAEQSSPQRTRSADAEQDTDVLFEHAPAQAAASQPAAAVQSLAPAPAESSMPLLRSVSAPQRSALPPPAPGLTHSAGLPPPSPGAHSPYAQQLPRARAVQQRIATSLVPVRAASMATCQSALSSASMQVSSLAHAHSASTPSLSVPSARSPSISPVPIPPQRCRSAVSSKQSSGSSPTPLRSSSSGGRVRVCIKPLDQIIIRASGLLEEARMQRKTVRLYEFP